PGGDLSEPVSQNTLRVVSVFWALDSTLADRRHFPAINWLRSYTLYQDTLTPWFEKNAPPGFMDQRNKMMMILQKESELQEIVQLVGADALPERERVLLDIARMIREDFLQQNAYHEIDSYCSLEKQYYMANAILKFYEKADEALDAGIGIAKIETVPVKDEIARMKYVPGDEFRAQHEAILKHMDEQFAKLEA
ncbi:MAG: ATP synthase beta subunit C-terminal domain-containing protein, partial [Candidatus Syntropharchaeales archaeon]